MLGLQHEAAALIEIDALAAGAAAVVMPLDRPLQAIVTATANCSVGTRHVQHVAEFVEEGGVVGPLRHAGAVPPNNESLHRIGGETIERAMKL